MRSLTTPQFWKLYNALPEEIRRRADRAYKLWQINPNAHGLYFKRVSERQPLYFVRIGQDYRALGLRDGDSLVWFWIGPHDAYERMIGQI